MLQQIRHDFSCCLAKRIRKNTGNADIGNGHTVLDAILLGRLHADQLETVSGKFPKLTKIFWRNKGTSDKIKFVEVSNPFRILFVRFLAFNGFDILRMCKADINIGQAPSQINRSEFNSWRRGYWEWRSHNLD